MLDRFEAWLQKINRRLDLYNEKLKEKRILQLQAKIEDLKNM